MLVTVRTVASLAAFALLVAAFLWRHAPVEAEVHFAPEEDLERIDVELIDGARGSIDMAGYVLTDRSVIGALERASRRGVTVRVWRDPGMAERVGAADIAAIVAPDEPRVTLREKERGPLMHLKSYCIDGKVLRTGSANFTRSGLREQDNDLVVLRSTSACARFEAKFARIWSAP